MSEKSQELVKGLNKISRATIVFISGSPFAGSLASMVFALMIKRFDVMLSYFFMLNELPNLDALILIFIGDFLLLALLAVGGGLLFIVISYLLIFPAFKSFKEYDNSFNTSLIFVKSGYTGSIVMFVIALIVFITEGATAGKTQIAPLLLGVAVILLALTQVGLILGLLKLRDIFEDSKFYIAAVMFAVNIVLSFMLSPMAVLSGFAGWIVTYLATRSALKELEQA